MQATHNKMAGTVLDLKSFIRPTPLPIPSNVGVAIQARNSTVYSVSVPTRDEIRKENFLRRSQQLSHQGFWTAITRPYEEVGGPIYLDVKKLLLDSLGQSDVVGILNNYSGV